MLGSRLTTHKDVYHATDRDPFDRMSATGPICDVPDVLGVARKTDVIPGHRSRRRRRRPRLAVPKKAVFLL
jgi:hypothetical protein